jgi:hypothetical protein
VEDGRTVLRNTFNTDSSETTQRNLHIKVLIPSWAQTLFRRAGGVCLIGVNGDDSEWVWETENLSLHKGVGGKDLACADEQLLRYR